MTKSKLMKFLKLLYFGPIPTQNQL